MSKKALFLVSVLSAGAFVGANAASNMANLDVVVRDFQPSHPDFENFSEESVKHSSEILSYGKTGYDATWYGLSAYHNSCGNKESNAGVNLGKDGLPMVANAVLPSYLRTVSSSAEVLTYGQCSTPNATTYPVAKIQRGYAANTSSFVGVQRNTCNGDMYWSNAVVYTPGMAQTYLRFDTDSTGAIPVESGKLTDDERLYGAHIQKNAEACDNQYFGQWFEDVDGINKKSLKTLSIPVDATNSNFYELNQNYNNGGYFPLDSVDANYNRVGYSTDALTGSMAAQWGPQSFSIFCPPYAYQYASTQEDFLGTNTYALCTAWNAAGGAKGLSVDAAVNIANNNGTLGVRHLRNYNFTMMGSAMFRYHASNNTSVTAAEIFEFAGDDDMWIYVDGVLAVDLGGTHLSTPGSVNIYTLASNGHGCHAGEPLAQVQQAAGYCNGESSWADGSWHYLHFFYADRQTDGSNLYIRSSLAELAPSIFGQPVILEGELVKNDAGNLDTYIYLNTRLSDESIAAISASNGGSFPILATRKSALTGRDTLAYQVTSFAYVQKASKGYEYKITGKLCTDASCAVQKNAAFGDSLAFNYPYNSADEALELNKFHLATVSSPVITSASGKAVDTYNWGPITSVTVTTTTTIVPDDTTIDRPKFDMDKLDDGTLDDDATGEIIVSNLPDSYATSEDQNQWIADSLSSYTGAPSTDGSTTTSGSASVINSKTNTSAAGSGTLTEARCSTTNGKESCVSFSFVTDEAFRVNVRVFDHLGHFVSQYNQTMTPAQFNAATGSYSADGICSDKTGTGSVAVSVKTYPVSQDGRKLGTGAYIYQISLIEYPQPHCVNISGEQNYLQGEYRRTEYKQVRGFRRTTQK